mmetsp:Transcript_54517/g.118620  ORF Transcript_54517/g.118620 Transcript_54517/m.118620 type:complete len:195 (-) Transcript_54517:29-613(-)
MTCVFRPMYCSSTTMELGWPKQDEDLRPGATPPPGYGDGFRAIGVEPPTWFHKTDDSRVGEGGGAPVCGVGDLLRNGMVSVTPGEPRRYAMEPLMHKYGVDLYLCGHEHNYERLWPVLNGTYTTTYDAPGKPVHVVTGSGGAYGKDTFGGAGPWDAFRSNQWSYSDVMVNRTHMVFRQRLATNSTVLDQFTLTR